MGPHTGAIAVQRRKKSIALDSEMQPATAKWYDRRDYVFIEFCVEDSKDVKVKFEKSKLDFSCVGGTDNLKHQNEIDLFDVINPKESKHKRTDRSVLCCLRKSESGKSWPRLTKDKAKVHMKVRPPLRLRGPKRRRINCTRLENSDARNEFHHSLAEKLGEMELSVSSENTMGQKWTSISSAL
ncbi:hypothetical protein SKAU_G00100550 [Synaphobranchus kaupii]|uniref:Prostaglandin E synthase 3 n=1 Tax=Synaphobranchus kaupii TaxID=118154 RepID=A0A9Q1FZ40_SYNKA|nr:hypothetical protein SKAU_G00100550 [Synaphobranchus kaupii]